MKKYPVLFERQGKMDTMFMHYKLECSAGRMKLEIAFDRKLGPTPIRLGPFEKQPNASSVRVNGESPAKPSAQRSGDSWWVKSTMPVGSVAGSME